MKRAILLALTVLLLVALGAVVLAEIPAQTGMPAAAQARLGQYLATAYPSGGVVVQVAVRAKRAWRFDQAMSGVVFGDSVYYQTDSGPGWTERDSLLPLPYPPKEVWCVLLKVAPSLEGTAYRVVFPALHMDMYNADWLVHEAPQDLGGQALATIGCELGPEGTDAQSTPE
jgi:hypothetical protein